MQVVNKFLKGINRDLSRDLISPEMYFDAQNMTLITTKGQSTGAIQNVKGNLLAISLPGHNPIASSTQDTSNVSEIIITLGGPGNIDITLLVQPSGTSTTFTIAYDGVSKKYFYDNVASYINTNFNNVGVYAASNADHVVIWSGLDINNLLINTSITLTLGINTGTGFFTIDNNYVPTQSNLEWIGWGRIRDVFYLFSTNETGNASPINSYGQIWRFEYDKITGYCRLTLIYNNQINFTNFHPIANPGAFIGNYETELIQKIYWTDNYNRLRNLNTVDPNTFALLPDEIDIYPNISLSIPILQSVNEGGGTLLRGMWQTAYRLKSTTGTVTVTAFSTPSNPVLLVDHAINGSMKDYICDPTNAGDSGKSLTYKVSNVDNSYDRIEIVTLYRTELNQIPTIQMVVDEPILGNSEFTYTVNGNQTPVDITIDEFLADPLIFDTVKSIAVKNNFMFAGNVKYSDFDVNFDTRAYRYDNTGATYIDPILNPSDVNPNQDPGIQGDTMTGRFLFQSDGLTFGGGDPGVSNVWYEFTTPRRDTANAGDYDIVLDTGLAGDAGLWTRPYYSLTPGVLTYTADLDFDFDFEEYPNPNTYSDYHSPHISSALKQYRRDETYRIGIVFFSKKGEPSYTHWVGDIRFPHVFMPTPRLANVDRNPDNLLVPNNANWFPIAIPDLGTRIHYANPLGLKMTVNVSSIVDQISGFSIVRVKRENVDKTILGQGVLYPAVSDGNNYSICADLYDYINTGAGFNVSQNMGSFNCPDFLFKGSPSFRTNDFFDYINVLSYQVSSAQIYGKSDFSYSSANFKVIKYSPTNNAPLQLIDPSTTNPIIVGTAAVDGSRSYDYTSAGGGQILNMSGFFTGTAPANIYNASSVLGGGGGNNWPAHGSKTLLFGFTPNGVNYAANAYADGVVTTSAGTATGLYLCNYKRNVTQYGGNSISQRSTNEYISTGHYQPVDVDHSGVPSSLTYNYTGTVFGGDNYIALFDNVKKFPATKDNGGPPIVWQFGGIISTIMVGQIYPVETDININLRRSNNGVLQVMNKYPPSYEIDGYSNTDNAIDVGEEFILYDYVDIENDVKKFFPRPDPFIDRLKYDVRVFASQRKSNGELQDNWGVFKEADYIDVDSTQGPITNLITHKDKLLAYQYQGIVNLPVEERSLVQDSTGADLTLGKGGILPSYDYISKKIGSRHQFGFTQSPDAVFFFDMNSKNLYKQSDINPESISLIKGLSSYFGSALTGLIQIEDNPFRQTGITATYDFNTNEAIYTFRDKQKVDSNSLPTTIVSYPGNNVFIVQFTGIPFLVIGGEIIYEYIDPTTLNTISLLCKITALNATYPLPPVQATLQAEGIIELNNLPIAGTVFRLVPKPFTIAYNDFIDAFTSFYTFYPCMYVSDQLNYFTPNNTQNDLWVHRRGSYGSFYNQINNSSISFVVNPDYQKTKRFSNYTMVTESYDINGIEQIQDTFNQIRLYNTNQNTGFQLLPIDPVTGNINTTTGVITPSGPKQIARRVEDQWNLSYLFDRVLYTTPNPNIFTDLSTPNEILFGQRLRSKFINTDLVYNNQLNNQLILRSFTTNYENSLR